MRAWLKTGISAGAAFSVVGIAFVAMSLFTDVSRPVVGRSRQRERRDRLWLLWLGRVSDRATDVPRDLRCGGRSAGWHDCRHHGAGVDVCAGVRVRRGGPTVSVRVLRLSEQWRFECPGVPPVARRSCDSARHEPWACSDRRGVGGDPRRSQWDISADASDDAGRARLRRPRGPTSRCSRRAARQVRATSEIASAARG